MSKIVCRSLLVVALLVATFGSVSAQEYPSVPKGIVLEGAAVGIEPISSVSYDARRNAFIINDSAIYPNPVSPQDFKELCMALADHNHLGVSIRPDRSFFTYGRIGHDSRIARDLASADRLLGGVVFGMREFIGGRQLPGGYVPKSIPPAQRRIISASTWKFKDFRFTKSGQNVYRRVDYNLDSELTPVRRDSRARDGGYTSDPEAAQRGEIEPADRDNHNHIMTNRGSYMTMPEIDRAAKIGEAASFIRWVRGGSANRGVVSGGRTDLVMNLARQIN